MTYTTVNAYTRPEVVQSLQLGAKYNLNAQTDLIGAIAHIWQNDFRTAAPDNCGPAAAPCVGTASGGRRGHSDVTTLTVNYRPVKRLDVYGGFVCSHGTGGQVSGCWADGNATFTGGVRLSF